MPDIDFRKNSWFFLAIAFSLGCYVYLGFFLERHQSLLLLSSYFLLFSAYLVILGKALWTRGSDYHLKINHHQIAGIVLRLGLLFIIPNLSDDFFRFIWDGRLLAAGINPFAHLPSFYLEGGNSVQGLDQQLFEKLNSKEYFTIYPPVNQFIFWLAAIVSGNNIFGSVMVMRIFVFAAEVGNIWLLPKILARFNLRREASLIYIFNPLVIIEGVGNLHFEVMMFFFIMLSLWFLKENRLIPSAVAIALAVGTKLIPLIFLPFLPKPTNIKRMLLYYGIAGFSLLILFLPLLSEELINGLQSSISLYYQKFEFNASIYYILRELGFQEYGYNRIAYIGKDLVKWTFWLIMILAYFPFVKRPELPTLFMFALGIYLLFSTTVHPWYVVTFLGLSCFTNYRAGILWSGTIFLTYLGYHENGYELPAWVLFVEYGTVFGFFLFELARETGWLPSLTKTKQ